MPNYHIVKVIPFAYELAAENEDAALAVIAEEPPVTTIVRQKARDTATKPASANVITDRVMRAGRVFTRKYKGASFAATCLPGGKIRLEGEKMAEGQVFATLHKATQAAIEVADGRRHSANAYQFWHEAEQGKAAGPPKPKKGDGKSDEGETEQQSGNPDPA